MFEFAVLNAAFVVSLFSTERKSFPKMRHHEKRRHGQEDWYRHRKKRKRQNSQNSPCSCSNGSNEQDDEPSCRILLVLSLVGDVFASR